MNDRFTTSIALNCLNHDTIVALVLKCCCDIYLESDILKSRMLTNKKFYSISDNNFFYKMTMPLYFSILGKQMIEINNMNYFIIDFDILYFN